MEGVGRGLEEGQALTLAQPPEARSVLPAPPRNSVFWADTPPWLQLEARVLRARLDLIAESPDHRIDLWFPRTGTKGVGATFHFLVEKRELVGFPLRVRHPAKLLGVGEGANSAKERRETATEPWDPPRCPRPPRPPVPPFQFYFVIWVVGVRSLVTEHRTGAQSSCDSDHSLENLTVRGETLKGTRS